MNRRHPITWSFIASLFGCFIIGSTTHRHLETCCRRHRGHRPHHHPQHHHVVVVDAFITPPTTTATTAAFQQRRFASTATTATNHVTIRSFLRRRMDSSSSTLATITTSTQLPLSNNNNTNNNNKDDNNNNEVLSSFLSSAFKPTNSQNIVEVGDTIVCKRAIPSLGILENSSHVVTSIYAQYFDEEIQQIVKIPLSSLPLDGDYDNLVAEGQQQQQGRSSISSNVYMTLLVPQSDDASVGEGGNKGVIVTPEEVGLVSLQNELGNAIWLAVPGLFWVGLASSFYNTYHERTGGSLGDAFWGR